MNNALISQNNPNQTPPFDPFSFAHSIQRYVNQQLLKNNGGNPADLLLFSSSSSTGSMEEQWKLALYYKDNKLSSYQKTTMADLPVIEKTTFTYNQKDQLINISINHIINGRSKMYLKSDLSYNLDGQCTKRLDYQGHLMTRGDSVQINSKDNKVTEYLIRKFNDGGWITTSKVSDISYNKSGMVRSYISQTYSANGFVTKKEFLTNLEFYNANATDVMKRVCPGINPGAEVQSEDMKLLDKVLNGPQVISDKFLNNPVAYHKFILNPSTNRYVLSEIRSFFQTRENALYVFTENIIVKDKSVPVVVEKFQLDDQNRVTSVHQTFQKGEYIHEENLNYNYKGFMNNHVQETTSFSEYHNLDQRSEQNFTISEDGNLLKKITEERKDQGDGDPIINELTFRYKTKDVETKSFMLSDHFQPVPTQGVATLQPRVKTEIDQNSVTVHDLSGQRVRPAYMELNSGKIEIDLSNLPAGVYLVNYESDHQNYVSKIVKN